MSEFYDQYTDTTPTAPRFTVSEKVFFGIVAVIVLATIAVLIFVIIPMGEQNPTVDTNVVPAYETSAPAGPQLPVEPPVQINHDGNWLVDSGNGAVMTAVISSGTIEITLENEGSSMLYWVGTFDAAAPFGTTVSSEIVEVPKAVLSNATQKDFTINENGTIGFDLTAMGMTKKLELHRV